MSLWMILWMRMKISPSPAAITPMPRPAGGSQGVSIRLCATKAELCLARQQARCLLTCSASLRVSGHMPVAGMVDRL